MADVDPGAAQAAFKSAIAGGVLGSYRLTLECLLLPWEKWAQAS